MKSAKWIIGTLVAVGLGLGITSLIKNTTSHQYDGLYITNKSFLGISSSWIINGNQIVIYPSSVDHEPISCKQYNDRIEFNDGRKYKVDEKGNIIISQGKKDIMGVSVDVDLKMVKVSDKTDFTVDEVSKILSESYEK